jgi:hypothetical protein
MHEKSKGLSCEVTINPNCYGKLIFIPFLRE